MGGGEGGGGLEVWEKGRGEEGGEREGEGEGVVICGWVGEGGEEGCGEGGGKEKGCCGREGSVKDLVERWFGERRVVGVNV